MWSLKPGFGAVMLVMVTKSSPSAFSLSLSIFLLLLGQDDSKPGAGIRTQRSFQKRLAAIRLAWDSCLFSNSVSRHIFEGQCYVPRKQIRLNKVSISDMLTHRRQQRRLAGNQDVWKTFFFETVTFQRREVRAWKSSKLQTWLQHAGTWKGTRQPQNVANRQTTAQALPHAFADTLEGIFNRKPGAPTQPEQLDEPVWTCRGLIDSLMIHLEQAKFGFECGENIGALRKMDYHTVKTFVQEPHPNEFAKMLEELFSGIVTEPVKPDIFTEQMFELKELKTAIGRAKLAKAAEKTGLTAELLRHMPDDICNDLLQMFNHMLLSGEVPAAWRKTLFKMLPKTLKPRTTTDFRPIATIRLFYKTFAYMILGQIEDTLETSQPEEQHGFRAKKRIEEHLLTFNVILDKTLEMDQPLWIITLDLSKAFHRVNWGITLASGGRSWRITAPGLDPPSSLLSATWDNCWINGKQLRI